MTNYPTYKLGEICYIVYGKGFPTKNLKQEGFPVYGANGVIGYNETYLYEEEQVLISCRGAYSGKINRSPEKCWVTNNSLVIIPNTDVCKDFLYYALQSANKEKLVTGTAQPQVTINNAIELQIPLPPLATQRAIVTRIESLFAELDKGVEKLKTAQQQLKVYRQAVLNDCLTKGSEKWEKVKLGEVIEKPTYGTSKKCDYGITGTGVLRIPNIGDGYIVNDDMKFAIFSEEEKKKYSLKNGDLLTIRSNGSVDLVGKCALITLEEEKYLFAGYLIRLRPNNQIVESKYLLYVLMSHNLRVQIEEKAKSTSGVNNINSVEIQNLQIVLPPLPEQQRIVQEIETRLSACDVMEKNIAESLQQAEALRQSILKKAFEGELV